MSECTHNCSTCSANCSSRTEKQSLLTKPHDLSHVKKIIGVCSGKGGLFGGKHPTEEELAGAAKWARECMNKFAE